MSIPNKATVNCPDCNTAFTTTVWSSVNTDLSDDLAKKIISGDFFDAKCPKCGFTAHMEYDVLYHDVKRSVMIWVVHTNTPEYEKKCSEIRNTRVLPGYKVRMVRDMNELREKVAALEAGRDDRVIEICKHFIKFEATQQHPEFETKNLFYTYADGEEIVILYDINGKDMSCYLDSGLYDMMKEKFSEKLMDSENDNYAIYDAEWAEKMFIQHFEEQHRKEAIEEDFNEEFDEIEDAFEEVDDNNKSQITLFDVLEDESSSTETNKVTSIISNKNASCFEENPFYILEVSPIDKRTDIIQKAEEKSFFADDNRCNDAQTILLNPEKRLTAELDWFYNISKDDIEKVISGIRFKTAINTNILTDISKLNATLHNFSIAVFEDYFELGYAILDIDEQFECLSSETLCTTINKCRKQSGIREISQDELGNELNKKREQIRQIIGSKTNALEDNEYIELITMIAEKCIADDFYEDGIILSDIIDQYEVKMQSTIDEANEKILSHIEKIKTLANDEGIESNLTGLISRVKKWDVLVQPLQLKSQASGVVHRDSRNIGGEIRELSLWIHNEKGLSELALKLVEAMRSVFAELTDLADMFESDSDALTNIIKGNKEAEQAVAEMDSIKVLAELLKGFATSIKIDEFINKVKAANRRIKNVSLDDELISKIRENICYIARDVAITLHNDKQETDYALRIATMLVNEFGDLPEIKAKLSEDVSTLNQQALLKNRIKLQQEAREREEKTKNIGCLVVIGIIVLIMIISSLSQCSSSTSSTSSYSSSSSSSSSSYSSSSSAAETQFSQSASSGTKVYANIVSIFPEMGIYTQGSSTYSSFVCKCKTSSGSTVWIHMSVSEYKSNFDSSASTNVYSQFAEEVTFSTTKKIHGTAKTSNSVLSGLSTDIGVDMLIDFTSVD